jgi:hypothetical protein
MVMRACRRRWVAGGVDAATRRPAGVVDADAQYTHGRARADPLRRRGVAVAVLGQLADVAHREAGKLGDALDADAGGAQNGDVLTDGTGVGVRVSAAVDPFPVRGAAAAVLDVGSAGAVLVASLRMGALACHSGLEPLGSATGLLEAAPVLIAGVSAMVSIGEWGAVVSRRCSRRPGRCD